MISFYPNNYSTQSFLKNTPEHSFFVHTPLYKFLFCTTPIFSFAFICFLWLLTAHKYCCLSQKHLSSWRDDGKRSVVEDTVLSNITHRMMNKFVLWRRSYFIHLLTMYRLNYRSTSNLYVSSAISFFTFFSECYAQHNSQFSKILTSYSNE